MNREDLVEILEELAITDLPEGGNLHDHPCIVAIRAIDKAFEDIESLRTFIHADGTAWRGSKKIKMLTGLRYDPEW